MLELLLNIGIGTLAVAVLVGIIVVVHNAIKDLLNLEWLNAPEPAGIIPEEPEPVINIPQSYVAGVSYDTDKDLWRVRFRVDGVRTHFGYFEDKRDAEALCLQLREQLSD